MLKTNGPQQQAPPKIAKRAADPEVTLELAPEIVLDIFIVFIILYLFAYLHNYIIKLSDILYR
jgi:hypothetical protein